MEFTTSDFVAWVSLLISIWLTFYNWYNSNRLKTLESNLEIQKNKSLLNDKKNRETFQTLIQSFINLMFPDNGKNEKDRKKDEESLKKDMIEVKKFLLINWSWGLVKNFNDFILITQRKDKTNKEMYNSFDKLLKKFREEIWVKNNWLKENDLLQLFVNEKIN